MAAQVLSGTGNVSYTNSTGQNVRLVINYLRVADDCTVSFTGISIGIGANGAVYGNSLGYRGQTGTEGASADKAWGGGSESVTGLPLEIALANGDTFSISADKTSSDIEGYNIIIIPEAG